MAGILVSGEPQGVEATGVFKGVLVEDMIDTVSRVKKPFIDVFISSVFFEDADYPLTYVPMFNMVLPLKKDQEVWVYFNQDNHRYPVLWKLADDVSEEYTEQFTLPGNGDLVSFPSAEDTTEVTKFSDSFWFIGTKSYGVFHWGDQCVLLNDDSVIMNAKSKLGFKSGGTVSIEAPQGVVVKSSAGKMSLEASGIDLGTELYNVFDALATTQPTTQGSPAAQSFNPAIIAKLTALVAKLSLSFKA